MMWPRQVRRHVPAMIWAVAIVSGWTAPGHAQASGLSRVEASDGKLTGDVRVVRSAAEVAIDWPSNEAGQRSRLVLSLDKERPLIRAIKVAGRTVLNDIDPAGVVTVGTRDLKQGWTIFFDNPRERPFEAFAMTLARDRIRVRPQGGHTIVDVAGARAGPFEGTYRFTIYPGSRLIRAAMVMSTEREATAYTFDAGLTASSANPVPWRSIAFTNLSDELERHEGEAALSLAVSPKVRGRTIVAEGRGGGAVAIVPPPHQFYYPLDYANNDNSAWFGKDYRKLDGRIGLGVRQTLEGDDRWVPWVNAPVGSVQDMGIFLLPDEADADSATRAAMALTRNDRFKALDGYRTFSSHYHVEHAVDFLNRQRFQQSTGVPAGLEKPEFVDRFKAMNIEIVHLAELHLSPKELNEAGDRLTLLKTIHDETARLSDDQLLLLPGEEPNTQLGGHWLSLFPKPVYWTLDRKGVQAFVEDHPTLGKVYHVGSSQDVLKLMEAEKGLMWTAHPRIKSSFGFPDAYRCEAFFKSDRFLGGAWKSMPADYSQPRLGSRVLNLLDDMNNWASVPDEHKYALGEVDVFQITRDSELYAHMNVNYLRLPGALPTHSQGWGSVLDALRGGRFFTTTGEVLIPDFTIGGVESGGQVTAGAVMLRARIENTFPLSFAEVVSGDGRKVYRERIDLTGERPFASRTIERRLSLRDRTWARLEVWDVAANGAVTQPVFVK